MENEMISVLLVDDEKIVREGLRVLLDWSSLGCCICGEASNGKEALLQIERYHPSLVLLDIRIRPKMVGCQDYALSPGEGIPEEGQCLIVILLQVDNADAVVPDVLPEPLRPCFPHVEIAIDVMLSVDLMGIGEEKAEL